MGHALQHAAPLPANPAHDASADLRASGYGMSVVVNAILLYVAHRMLAWGVPIVRPAFNEVLRAIDLSLGATIVANAIFLAYDASWFRQLSETLLDLLALLSVYTIYLVFPFQFDQPGWYDFATLTLLVVMFAIVIAVIVNAIQAMLDGLRYATRARCR
jgi:hypothetical protein